MLEEKIKEAKKYHRLFQGLVAILSNHRAGIKIDKDFIPGCVFKYEGGVVVNKKDIVIGYGYFEDKIGCYDDNSISQVIESSITATAVTDLLNKIDWSSESNMEQQIEDLICPEVNISKEDLKTILEKFCNKQLGDPLRNLFLY